MTQISESVHSESPLIVIQTVQCIFSVMWLPASRVPLAEDLLAGQDCENKTQEYKYRREGKTQEDIQREIKSK